MKAGYFQGTGLRENEAQWMTHFYSALNFAFTFPSYKNIVFLSLHVCVLMTYFNKMWLLGIYFSQLHLTVYLTPPLQTTKIGF